MYTPASMQSHANIVREQERTIDGRDLFVCSLKKKRHGQEWKKEKRKTEERDLAR